MRIALLCLAIIAALSGCGKHRAAQPGPAGPAAVKAPPPKKAAPERLTTELIARTPDDKLVELVMTCVWAKIGDDWEHADEIIARLPKGCKPIDAIWAVDAEVCNGGFAQYFVNTGGVSAMAAVEGYRLIGAPKHEALMKQAIPIAVKELSSDIRKDVKTDMEAFMKYCRESDLSSLDQIYFDLADSEDVFKLMASYIRSHPADFIEK